LSELVFPSLTSSGFFHNRTANENWSYRKRGSVILQGGAEWQLRPQEAVTCQWVGLNEDLFLTTKAIRLQALYYAWESFAH